MAIEVVRGDIVKQDTEAIVNSVPSAAWHPGKLNKEINLRAGPLMAEECLRLCKAENDYRFCGVGQARMTLGYDLPALYVIHTVGPEYIDSPNNETELRSCYFSCMTFAFLQGLMSISFPCISTGLGRYPSMEASKIALFSVDWFLKNHDTSINLVRFVCHKQADYLAYMQTSKEMNLAMWVSKHYHSKVSFS